MEIEGEVKTTVDITIKGMDYGESCTLAYYLEDMDKKLPNGIGADCRKLYNALKDAARKARPQIIEDYDDE